jgi:hypothetical protein
MASHSHKKVDGLFDIDERKTPTDPINIVMNIIKYKSQYIEKILDSITCLSLVTSWPFISPLEVNGQRNLGFLVIKKVCPDNLRSEGKTCLSTKNQICPY